MPELKFPKASVIRIFTLQTELIDPPIIRLELTPAGSKEKLKQALGWKKYIKDREDVEKLSSEELIGLIDAFDDLLPIITKHIIGWDLTMGGEPILCSDEEKAKWFEPLLWEMVIPEVSMAGFDPGDDDDEKKAPDTWLWSAIMKIISNRENFIKN